MNNIVVTGKQINYLEAVVYNGLQPAGIAGGGGGGDTSDLYYSKTALDGGQLDSSCLLYTSPSPRDRS